MHNTTFPCLKHPTKFKGWLLCHPSYAGVRTGSASDYVAE
jgi:hypothetical protein